MIKAIIFDCFGVLVTEQWLAFKDEYFGVNTPAAAEAAELLHQTDAGLLDYNEFLEQLAQKTGLAAQEIDERLSQNAPNRPLFEYIEKQLKPHYKIGMLSNAASNWLSELFTTPQLKLLDAIALSFESGVAKPDERAYTAIADKLGVAAEECVFVDDQERHCAGARDTGMAAVLYKNVAQATADLEKILAK
jgi:putative hydrolase of the HAD superfamily